MIGHGRRSGADWKYAHSGANPIKSNVWHTKRHSELSFGKANTSCPFP